MNLNECVFYQLEPMICLSGLWQSRHVCVCVCFIVLDFVESSSAILIMSGVGMDGFAL